MTSSTEGRATNGRSGGDLDVISPGMHHNPSSWRQRVAIALIATVAFLIATYMGLYQWGLIGSVWDPVFGHQSVAVLDSNVSHQLRSWFMIPDAVLGAIGYLGDAIFGMAGSTRRWQYRPWMVILFGIDVIPLGLTSAILVVMQGFVVGSWCFLCLVTATISLVLVVMAVDEVLASLKFLHRVWKHTHDRSALWDAFRGHPRDAIAEVALVEHVESHPKHARHAGGAHT